LDDELKELNDDYEEQTISIIEIKRKFNPELVVVKDSK